VLPVRAKRKIEQLLDGEPVAGHLDLNIDRCLIPKNTH